jgi:hypothetical protein
LRREHVAGHLVDHELIETHVAVERADDPITIRPDDARLVFFIAIRVRIPRDVEPVPAPALAVVRGSEQTVDQFLVSVRIRIVDEGVDFLRAKAGARRDRG